MEINSQLFSLLRKNPLFVGVPDEKMEPIINCLNGRRKYFDKRALLFQSGSPVSCLGIVLSGCVETFMPGTDGSFLLLSQAGPGELFAQALTIARNNRHAFQIYACDSTEILFLTVPEFTAMKNIHCTHRFQVMENLMKLVAEENMDMMLKFQILSQKSLRQKLLLYFSILSAEQSSSRILLSFGRDKLASFLGCDRSALSRELSRMQQDGLIECSRRAVTLKYV